MSSTHSLLSSNTVSSGIAYNPAQPVPTFQSALPGIDSHSRFSHLHAGTPLTPAHSALPAQPSLPTQPSPDLDLQHRGLDFTSGIRVYPQPPQTLNFSRLTPQVDTVHTHPVSHPVRPAHPLRSANIPQPSFPQSDRSYPTLVNFAHSTLGTSTQPLLTSHNLLDYKPNFIPPISLAQYRDSVQRKIVEPSLEIALQHRSLDFTLNLGCFLSFLRLLICLGWFLR